MSESSRAYWRNPRLYSRNKAEARWSDPAHYSEGSRHLISMAIVDALEAVKADKDLSVLEIGCNCGRNIHYLVNAGYERVAGVEINPEAVELAWSVYPHVAMNMRVSDAQSFLAQCPPDSWGMIYTQSVLMHVPPEDDFLLNQMSRVASKMILTCEVELDQRGSLMRHKFARNYQDVFENFGWTQIYVAPDDRRRIRVFSK